MKKNRASRPEDLTIQAIEKALKWPSKKWHGNCYAVACGIVEKKLVKGRAVYGHYRGPVASTGYWADRGSSPLLRHGWIVLDDGRILDPTRWSFEDKKPYIYLVEPPTDDTVQCSDCGHMAEEHEGGTFMLPCSVMGCPCECFDPAPFDYDEGGNAVREAMERPCPAYSPDDKKLAVKFDAKTKRAVMDLLGNPPGITVEHGFWIANLSLRRLGPHARAIFKAFVDAGDGGMIPTDNRRAVLGADRQEKCK